MIPVIALDPATLSLWFDPELILNGFSGGEVASAIDLAIRGDTAGTVQAVTATTPPTRTRAAHLVSAVWHEHRHFVDLLLTNYGAFRVRQFLSLYTNQAQVFRLVDSPKQPLVCPVDAYLDPVRRDILNVHLPPPEVLDVAREVQRRKQRVRADRQLVASPHGPIEIGGEAQLEALAYACQFYAIQEHLSTDILRDVHNDLPEAQRFHLRYRWAVVLAAELGLAPAVLTKDGKISIIDHTLLVPLLIGSLASRHWGQEQTGADPFNSGFPATRFAAFLQAFQGRKLQVSTAQAWELINEQARRLWRRTVVEEIQADYAKEGEWCQTVGGNDSIPDQVKAIVHDYHGLRGRLIEELITHPERIVDVAAFVKELLPRLRPIPILARPSGQLGVPPEGAKRVIGYHDVESKREDGTWWWAATYDDWPHNDPALFVLRARDAWLSAVDELAPLAKMLIGGRAHRGILGPELFGAEQRLKGAGLTLLFEPLFEFPELMSNAQFFWQLTGLQEAKCDLCWTLIHPPNGAAVSPWAFRESVAMARFAIAAFGGDDEGLFQYRRDWSHWVVCDLCAEGLATRRLEALWSAMIERRRAEVQRRGTPPTQSGTD